MQKLPKQYVALVAGCFCTLILEHVMVPLLTFNPRVEDASKETTEDRWTELPVKIPLPRSGLPLGIFSNQPTFGKTRVYRSDGESFVRLYDFCSWPAKFDCVRLITPFGDTPIHVHSLVDDTLVSGTLTKTGRWEPASVDLILAELQKDPDLGFLDLGSHVGAFSLSVARLGRKVVSVDPLIENVQRLCKSIQKGGFTDRMTIIFNPLSDRRSVVNFKLDWHNVGGTSIVEATKSGNTSFCGESTETNTVMLDDILPFIPFKKAIVKMDVQEHEYRVLKGGARFLQEVDVRAIIMEWDMIKLVPDGRDLIDLLQGHKFRVRNPQTGSELDPLSYRNWPNDVLWYKT